MPLPSKPRGMISLDTEDSGLDFYHGARPFFVTSTNESGNQTYWEWSVDPLTRQPQIPDGDLDEIRELISSDDLVLQNAKFDVFALNSVGIDGNDWPWNRTHDTLYVGHLLASNQPHDLTSMALQYLGVNIKPYEDAIKKATAEARRIARSKYPEWRIAKKGLAEMPSAKESVSLFDMFLPRAIAMEENYADDHPWWTVLAEYSNADSAVTLPLFKRQKELLIERGLWEIYLERIKTLPVVYSMESVGITANSQRLHELKDDYVAESEKAGRICTNIATSMGADYLELPKSGNNNSLVNFVFNPTKRPLVFVFGSNREGRHGLGAALEARQNWGAVYGQAKGRQGNSYAIVTKELRKGFAAVTLDEVRTGVEEFLVYAREHTDIAFRVTPIGCGHAGFKPEQIGPLFEDAPDHVFLPEEFGGDGVRWGMGLPHQKLSKKTGAPSLDKTVMEQYLSILPERSKQLTFIKTLMGKRSRDTACSYMESYESFWLPTGIFNDDGEQLWFRLHPSLNPVGTATTRWSSSNPNSQNISKKEDFNLRYAFGPLPGREWWSLDYQNIELRIPAYESNERVMIELFEKPDEPPYFGSNHLMNASMVYPEQFWPLAEQKGAFKKKYASTYYAWIKAFDFAVSYGAMPESGTADRAAHKPGAQLLVVDRLKEHSKLNRKWVDFANRYGYVETMPDKEICPERGYPLQCSRSAYGKVSPTIPLNYRVQGTAGWVMMRAVTKIHNCLSEVNASREKSQHCHLVMTIHDEAVLDAPAKPNRGNLPIIRKVQRIMESLGDCISVPLTVGIELHTQNWSVGETI